MTETLDGKPRRDVNFSETTNGEIECECGFNDFEVLSTSPAVKNIERIRCQCKHCGNIFQASQLAVGNHKPRK